MTTRLKQTAWSVTDPATHCGAVFKAATAEEAAPELYEALSDLLERAELLQEECPDLDRTPFPPSLIRRARAALARARPRLDAPLNIRRDPHAIPVARPTHPEPRSRRPG